MKKAEPIIVRCCPNRLVKQTNCFFDRNGSFPTIHEARYTIISALFQATVEPSKLACFLPQERPPNTEAKPFSPPIYLQSVFPRGKQPF